MIARFKSGNIPVKRYSGKIKMTILNYGPTMQGVVMAAAGKDPKFYQIKIGSATVFTEPEAFAAFENGKKYTIYGVESAVRNYPTMLSAERLE